MQTASTTETWDLEIKPKTKLLDLHLKDVWKYRDLMVLFVKRDFVAQYKQTILGPVWHFIQPILTTMMFVLVFGRIARIPTEGVNPILFYLSGITIWNYFSASLTNTSSTFISNAHIFGKVYFPRLVMPISVILSNLIRLGIQFLLLFSVMAWRYLQGDLILITWYWLCIPLIILLMAGISLGCGIVISSLTTKYRDFNVLLGFIVQLGMYATPVAYPLSYLKGKGFKWIVDLNPLTSVVEAFRYCLLGRGTVEPTSILYSIVFMLIVLFIGAILFNKTEKTFMDTV
nr:ABC transporter permease [Pedobacter xinjiangensis]